MFALFILTCQAEVNFTEWVLFNLKLQKLLSLVNVTGQTFPSKTIPNMIWNTFSREEPYLHLKLYV